MRRHGAAFVSKLGLKPDTRSNIQVRHDKDGCQAGLQGDELTKGAMRQVPDGGICRGVGRKGDHELRRLNNTHKHQAVVIILDITTSSGVKVDIVRTLTIEYKAMKIRQAGTGRSWSSGMSILPRKIGGCDGKG